MTHINLRALSTSYNKKSNSDVNNKKFVRSNKFLEMLMWILAEFLKKILSFYKMVYLQLVKQFPNAVLRT